MALHYESAAYLFMSLRSGLRVYTMTPITQAIMTSQFRRVCSHCLGNVIITGK